MSLCAKILVMFATSCVSYMLLFVSLSAFSFLCRHYISITLPFPSSRVTAVLSLGPSSVQHWALVFKSCCSSDRCRWRSARVSYIWTKGIHSLIIIPEFGSVGGRLFSWLRTLSLSVSCVLFVQGLKACVCGIKLESGTKRWDGTEMTAF